MNKRVIAYLTDAGLGNGVSPEQAALLTQINYSFGLVKDGRASVSHLRHTAQLDELRRAYPHLKICLSIGGWGAGGFSEAAATEAGRRDLAESVMEIVRGMKLDGVDWDWEYPTSSAAGIASSPDDAWNVTELLTLMREMMNAYERECGRRVEQSIAVGADRVNDYLWKKALPALDTVNLMTYDMRVGGQAGHMTNLYPGANASYSTLQSVQAFEKAGVPKDKLLIGGTFYYRSYEGENLVPGGPCRCEGKSIPVDRLDEAACERLWDDTCHAAMYRYGGRLYTGDDFQSLQEKAEYIHEENLGGIIIWELGLDRRNRLLPALKGLNG